VQGHAQMRTSAWAHFLPFLAVLTGIGLTAVHSQQSPPLQGQGVDPIPQGCLRTLKNQ